MVFVTERDPGVGVSSFLPPRPPLQRAPGEKRPENRRVLPLGWLGAGRGDGWLCNCCPLVHAAAGSPGSPAAPAQSLGCWGMLAAAGRLLASSVAFCPVKIILKLVLLAGRKYALPCPAHISASLASGLCRVPWQRLCARSWRLEAAKTREVWLFQLHPNFLSFIHARLVCVGFGAWAQKVPKAGTQSFGCVFTPTSPRCACRKRPEGLLFP